MGGDLIMAAELLKKEGQSLVVVRDGRLLFSSQLPGIQPLLDALDNNVLPGSAVADKIMGRAAAMVVALGQANAVHAPVMSQSAVDVLTDSGILHCADTLVPCILNEEGTDTCPLEIATEFTVVPEKGVGAVRKLVDDLQSMLPQDQVH